MPKTILVTQPLIDAQPHLDVVVNDTVLPTQLTNPVTQPMLDADPTLVAAGFKVGDIIANGPVVPTPTKTFSLTVSGSVDPQGNFTATVSGDLTGSAKGVINADGTFNGSFTGTVPTTSPAAARTR